MEVTMKRKDDNRLPLLKLDWENKYFLLGPSACVAVIGITMMLKGIPFPSWFTQLFIHLIR
jgi:hypothetical protein